MLKEIGTYVLEHSTALGVIASSISLIIAILRLTKEIRSRNLRSLFYLHQYLSQNDLAEARMAVRTKLYKRDVDKWSPAERDLANKVCASYDQAGLLVTAGLLDKRAQKVIFESSWGESICDQYEALSDYLDTQQTPKKTGRSFFVHFTALYKLACKYHRT